ncbi:MAG: hypothetical protein VYE18_06290, partial [Pseudomonadota bacterium]|nr:hypothetical protein [Pseudomonadota bacterium]
GTNLVAMEAMATGVPSIIAANTGQLDIASPEHCYPLAGQGSVQPYEPYTGTKGWAEPSVEEAAALLEQVFLDRAEAERRGLASAVFMAKNYSWTEQVTKLVAAVDNMPALYES